MQIGFISFHLILTLHHPASHLTLYSKPKRYPRKDSQIDSYPLL